MNKSGWSFVADIVKSTKGSEDKQKAILELLEECRFQLNDVFKDAFRIEVEVSGGDSLQGVFWNLENAFLYGRLLNKLFYPEQIRFGVAEGMIIETNSGKSNSTGGDAFVKAQKALIIAKKKDLLCQIDRNQISKELSIIIDSTSLIKEKLTKRQREIDLVIEMIYPLHSYMMNEDIIQNKILNIFKYKRNSKLWKIHSMDSKVIDSVIKSSILKKNKFDSTYYPIALDVNQKVNPQGMNNSVLQIVGTTQQNISDKIDRARIKEIRVNDEFIYSKIASKGMVDQ